ncbi:protein NIM1-INTERACTING 2 [Humulus lupulus]|uniref:protein NIM1-INTERACTING 2 n=1 Tax=Humulus lupulus TaxID=3486 RepID=UPI002B4098C0|nr:protein NIM1-INTERACTING 2 [Humulus lupulus]
MEQGKRKRRQDGEVDVKRRKSEESISGVGKTKTTVTATEDEVEEFFAILKRIHVAANYFKNKDGGRGRELTAEGWRAVVKGETETETETEVLGGDNGVEDETESNEVCVETEMKKRRGLDLNLEPPPPSEEL